MQQLSESEGVFFRREDYAGFWRRLFIDLVDFIVVVAVAVLLSMLMVGSSPTTEQEVQGLFLFWFAAFFLYFVVLKRTKIGTLGYLIGNVRIVNLRGERPSMFLLTLRLLFAAIGPMNFPLDLLWLSGDEHKQALRDKIAQTYVVKKDANPAGIGRILFCEYDLWSWRLLFREVKVDGTQSFAHYACPDCD